MATKASDYKRKGPKKERELQVDRNQAARPLDPVMYRARKLACRCGITTVAVQRANVRKITCRSCGHTSKEARPKPTQGMIRRFLQNLAFGGSNA
jgi:hypothetical protein